MLAQIIHEHNVMHIVGRYYCSERLQEDDLYKLTVAEMICVQYFAAKKEFSLCQHVLCVLLAMSDFF